MFYLILFILYFHFFLFSALEFLNLDDQNSQPEHIETLMADHIKSEVWLMSWESLICYK
jgi:hypothetical protein